MDIIKNLLNNEIAIHCDTEEKAEKLLNCLDSVGFIWYSGNSLLKNNYWLTYEEKTCYHINFDNKIVNFGNYNFYKNQSYKIISYEEAIKEYIMERKETNFEHYREEIEKIAKHYNNSTEVCAQIMEVFNIKKETYTSSSYFEDLFAWGMNEYKPVKEMTIEEISAILGCEVKIIGRGG